MRKGITQEQVNAAADALVAAGHKPTVEKIRQALGTGSPNTVMRMLDAWRGALALRLQEVIKLPDVPPEVGQAFAEVWRLAVAHADTLAHAALTEERNTLFAAQTDLTQERKLWEIALAEAHTNVAENTAKLAQAEAQSLGHQVLAAQLQVLSTDLWQQRDRLQAQLDTQSAEVDALRVERVAAQEHIRLLEDRAHHQVDQARQELKMLQQRLDQERREHSKAIAHLRAQHEELRTTARAAEQAAAHQAGRTAALETTLSQWRDTLPPTKRKADNLSTATKAKSKGRAGKVKKASP